MVLRLAAKCGPRITARKRFSKEDAKRPLNPVWVTIWVTTEKRLKPQINRNARKPHEYTVSGHFYWSE